jgi:hypothetical protein
MYLLDCSFASIFAKNYQEYWNSKNRIAKSYQKYSYSDDLLIQISQEETVLRKWNRFIIFFRNTLFCFLKTNNFGSSTFSVVREKYNCDLVIISQADR